MSISKLFAIVGDEEITYQNLANSMVRAKNNSKTKDCEITFATEYDFLNGFGKTGLVVWVDTEKLQSALDELKGGAK